MFTRRATRYTPVHERVFRRTKILPGPNACWEWCGPVNNAGYGLIKEDKFIGNYMLSVHRAVARDKGLDIEGHEIQHTCLNKLCVNPDHLIEGVPKDRYERLENKYGRYFQKPKNPYKKCPHCEKTTHVIWFNRVHEHCYPGMFDKYREYMKNYNK